jgi:Fe-S-cluster containining protein
MPAIYEPAGLQFSCSACGDCCTGDPGHVWVNDEEVAALAAAREMSVVAFEKEYLRKIGSRRSLFERFNGDCILFDAEKRRCTVYAARPTQCRTCPFWPSNVENAEAWSDTCEECPGAGAGELHSVESIRARLKEHKAARARD